LAEVQDLVKEFPVREGLLRRQVGAIQAVSGVSFRIRSGETLGLVGESGSGKSTVGRMLVHLEAPTSGQVLFRGADLGAGDRDALRRIRREMQMVFQDPYASLNPRHTVGHIVREPLEIHQVGTPAERGDRVRELLERVGLEAEHGKRYPHEFSGGQRQRVGIARALATHPALVVADEPVSALDVSIQAQIVNLLQELKEEMGLTYLFIAHDLAMVRHLCDRVAVMMLGKLVETGPRESVFRTPLHPYTRGLLAAVPRPDPSVRIGITPPLEGELPDPANPPPGCRFHTRCPFSTDRCREEEPVLRNLGSHDPDGHQVACHHAEELR
jgi:oligopeptide/dipeptide ABC transporter ATP-binding protein